MFCVDQLLRVLLLLLSVMVIISYQFTLAQSDLPISAYGHCQRCSLMDRGVLSISVQNQFASSKLILVVIIMSWLNQQLRLCACVFNNDDNGDDDATTIVD